MLLEIAIGDAYGAGFEFASADFVQQNNDARHYYVNPVFGAIGGGRYTDDAQMSLALAELMLLYREEALMHDDFAKHFFDCFKRDPRIGYSGYFYKVLNSSETYQEMMGRLRPDSDGAGAAMRSCPIGIFGDTDMVKRIAEKQARITHNTDGGVLGSMAVALSTHAFLFEKIKHPEDLGAFLNKEIGVPIWDKDFEGEAPNKSIEAAQAAITVVRKNFTYSEVLKAAVAFTGDVDTVAAVAMGIAAVSPYHTDDLDRNLFENLENGTFGRDYLRRVDYALRYIATTEGGVSW